MISYTTHLEISSSSLPRVGPPPQPPHLRRRCLESTRHARYEGVYGVCERATISTICRNAPFGVRRRERRREDKGRRSTTRPPTQERERRRPSPPRAAISRMRAPWLVALGGRRPNCRWASRGRARRRPQRPRPRARRSRARCSRGANLEMACRRRRMAFPFTTNEERSHPLLARCRSRDDVPHTDHGGLSLLTTKLSNVRTPLCARARCSTARGASARSR